MLKTPFLIGTHTAMSGIEIIPFYNEEENYKKKIELQMKS